MLVTALERRLIMTPDQEKYWPAVEAAIRSRAKDRQARVAAVAARLNELRERIEYRKIAPSRIS
jgi:hypothetical protein